MSQRSSCLSEIGVRYPIIQAPMAGGTSTPALAAAVSNAGALGSLGSGYDAPQKMVEEIRAVRALTSNPLQVNLFVPLPPQPAVPLQPMLKVLAPIYAELGMEAATGAPPPWSFSFAQQMEVVIEERVPIFSFTFGALEARYIEALHARGTLVIGTATTVAEAEHLAYTSVDAIVLQGAEAAAHRGSFLPAADNMVGLIALVQQTTARVKVPLIASGGIMDGRGINAALWLGADAVQMGTAFLLTHESGANEVYKDAVLRANPEETQITRAFSGREARGIRNRFMSEIESTGVAIPAFPIQNDLTRPMRRQAATQGNPDFLSLWSGQNGALGRRMGAAELVRVLLREMEEK